MSDLYELYTKLLVRGMPPCDGVEHFGLDHHDLKSVVLECRRVWYIEDDECHYYGYYGDDVQEAVKPQERVVIPTEWATAIITMHALQWARDNEKLRFMRFMDTPDGWFPVREIEFSESSGWGYAEWVKHGADSALEAIEAATRHLEPA